MDHQLDSPDLVLRLLRMILKSMGDLKVGKEILLNWENVFDEAIDLQRGSL